MSLGKTENGSDYWKVMLANGNSVEDYERERDGFEVDASQMPLSLNAKCGLAVVRDGVRLTDYLRFRVVYNEGKDIYTATRW